MPLPAKIEASVEAAAPTERPALHVVSRQVPPGGYWFRIVALAERAPREAMVGPFNALDDLVGEVRKRCAANGLDAPSAQAIEQANCERLPPGYCRDARGRRTTGDGSMALSLADVLAGTRALAGWFKHGSVSNEEVVRRTYVCNACPENVPVSGCQGCAGNALRQLSERIVVKALPSDAVLGACRICKCSLKTKTRFQLEDIRMSDAERARLPEACWIVAPIDAQRNDPRL